MNRHLSPFLTFRQEEGRRELKERMLLQLALKAAVRKQTAQEMRSLNPSDKPERQIDGTFPSTKAEQRQAKLMLNGINFGFFEIFFRGFFEY
jgi:hypothetical protein